MALVGVRLTAQLGDGFGTVVLHFIVDPTPVTEARRWIHDFACLGFILLPGTPT